MDARISDHSAWAARGHWRKAYSEALAEIARLQAEVEKWKEFSFDRDIKLIFEQERAKTARNDALEEAAQSADAIMNGRVYFSQRARHDDQAFASAIRALKATSP